MGRRSAVISIWNIKMAILCYKWIGGLHQIQFVIIQSSNITPIPTISPSHRQVFTLHKLKHICRLVTDIDISTYSPGTDQQNGFLLPYLKMIIIVTIVVILLLFICTLIWKYTKCQNKLSEATSELLMVEHENIATSSVTSSHKAEREI